MAGVVQTILTAVDRTAAAYTSARVGLQGIMSTSYRTSASLQATSASSQALAVRMGVLTDRIALQKEQLEILHAQLVTVTQAQTLDTIAIMRAQAAYNGLTMRIRHNEEALGRMDDKMKEAPKSVSRMTGAVGLLRSSLGALGIAATGYTAVNWMLSANSAANTLERTQATLKALLPDVEAYNEVMANAQANQRLFGGSLNENLQGLQGLALLTNQANVEMSALNEVTQKLGIKDPQQGATGAMIALTELLTGKGAESTRTLRMRYELTEQGLQAISRAPDAAGRIKALNDELERIGITEQVVKARLDTTSQSFADLKISVENLKLSLGSDFAEAAKPVVEWLTRMIDKGLQFRQTIADLEAGQLGTAPGTTPPKTYEEYRERVAADNKRRREEGGIWTAQQVVWTRKEYEYQQRRAAAKAAAAAAPVEGAAEIAPVAPPPKWVAPPPQTGATPGYVPAAPAPTGPGGTKVQPQALPVQGPGAAPFIFNNYAAVISERELTSVVQSGIREYERSNGRPR